jgi:hypothetical protein
MGIRKLLAAAVLTFGLCGTALAQQSSTTNTISAPDSANRVVCVNPTTHATESCAGSGGGGGGGAAQADNTALTDITGAGALFTATPPSVADGNVGIFRMSTDRYLFTIFPSAQPTSAAQSGAWSVGQTGVWTQRLFDGDGNSISSHSNALDTYITNALAVSWAAAQHVIVDTAPTTAVTGTFWQATQPVSAASLPLPTGASTEATLTAVYTVVDAGIQSPGVPNTGYGQASYGNDATSGNAYPLPLTTSGGAVKVDAASLPLPTGAAQDSSLTTLDADVKANITLHAGTNLVGKVGIDQTTPGTTNGVQVNAALPSGTNVIGHVIADSGSTTVVTGNVATTVADAANVTLGAKADAKSTATDTTAVTAMQVLKEISAMEQAPASRAVTNAGTFATQATLQAGAALVGKVGIDQTTPGTTNGVQVNAALPAGSNVIGHVIADSGSTTAVTGNVATTAADASNVTLGAKADAKSTATDTTAVTVMQVLKEISAMEQAPASRAVTNAGTFSVQCSSGCSAGTPGQATMAASSPVVIASDQTAVHVLADSGSTTAVTGNVATTAADASNVTIGAKADAKSTATDTTAVTVMQVLKEISAMEQAPASRAVTNAGTFATQPTIQTGSNQIGHLEANQSTNVAQFGGSAVVTGTGTGGSGIPRVTVSSDSTVKVDQTQSVTAFSLTNAQSSTVTSTGYGSVLVQFTTATSVGIVITGSTDGSNYAGVTLCPLDGGGGSFCTSNVGATGLWVANIQGLTNFRISVVGLGNQAIGNIVLAPVGTYSSNSVVVEALPANATVNVAKINSVAPSMGNGISGTGVQRVTIASDSTGQIAGPTLTKGSQGSTGFSVQNLYDAGRSRVSFTADRVTPAASDTLVTFVKNIAGTATTGQTTYTVTSAKTFRVTSIYVGLANTSTVSANVRVALRENTGGTCTASSAAVAMLQVASGAVAANEGANGNLTIPDGWEFPAADSVCISAIGAATTETLTISVMGYEY